jgi:hypothetical protein
LRGDSIGDVINLYGVKFRIVEGINLCIKYSELERDFGERPDDPYALACHRGACASSVGDGTGRVRGHHVALDAAPPRAGVHGLCRDVLRVTAGLRGDVRREEQDE